MRRQGLVSEADAVTEWIDDVRGTLFAESKGADGVYYLLCEVQGFEVSRVARAKETEAQPYFSPK